MTFFRLYRSTKINFAVRQTKRGNFNYQKVNELNRIDAEQKPNPDPTSTKDKQEKKEYVIRRLRTYATN